MTFEEFVATVGRQVRAGLVAANGAQSGADAAAEAMACAWEQSDQVCECPDLCDRRRGSVDEVVVLPGTLTTSRRQTS